MKLTENDNSLIYYALINSAESHRRTLAWAKENAKDLPQAEVDKMTANAKRLDELAELFQGE